MDMKSTVKMAAAGSAMVGALGFGIIGVGSGISLAKPDNPGPNPPGPSASDDSGNGNGNSQGNGNGSANGNANGNGNGNDNGNGGGSAGDDANSLPSWNGNGQGNVDATWTPGDPPGHNAFGPPGQVMKTEFINGFANPFYDVDPSQWATVNLDPAAYGVPALVTVDGTDFPVTFNATTFQWGYTAADGSFVVLTPQLVQS